MLCKSSSVFIILNFTVQFVDALFFGWPLSNKLGGNCVLQEVGAATSVGAGGMLLLMLGFAMMASFGLY
jgi:hypothetical protein